MIKPWYTTRSSCSPASGPKQLTKLEMSKRDNATSHASVWHSLNNLLLVATIVKKNTRGGKGVPPFQIWGQPGLEASIDANTCFREAWGFQTWSSWTMEAATSVSEPEVCSSCCSRLMGCRSSVVQPVSMVCRSSRRSTGGRSPYTHHHTDSLQHCCYDQYFLQQL